MSHVHLVSLYITLKSLVQDKEGLITELRKELRVSDDEHRELLVRVNNDEIMCRIRLDFVLSYFILLRFGFA